MNATMKTEDIAGWAEAASRVTAVDWERVSNDLDARGSATIERLITPQECTALAALYPIDGIFRSRVVMRSEEHTSELQSPI